MVRLLKPDRPRPRNYFSRREQWRLLVLVFATGAVMLAMRELNRPETSRRFAQVFAAESPPADVRASNAVTTLPATELSAEALATIRDNTYFRAAEKNAWFELIAKLQTTPAAELAARSVGDVGYVQLAQQPDVYRAKVVTVRGTVRQVSEQAPAENELGLMSYYRLVLQPSGREIWPIFVYALNLSPDFPRDDKVAVDVSATGYFFKNLSYQWSDGIGIAPVVLVKNVTRLDADAVPPLQVASRPPVVVDDWQDDTADAKSNATPDQPVADFSKVLSLAGWDAARFAQFNNGESLTPEGRQSLIQLLWRVDRFDTTSIAAWTTNDVSVAAVSAKPDIFCGKFLRLSGRLTRLDRITLSSADAERLEMSEYFECEVALEKNTGSATIITSHVPQSWLAKVGRKNLKEPATVAGLFIQLLPKDNERPHLLLVAKQVAADSFGRSALATMGMDVGLLDGIRNHRGILSAERDAFYRMLAAVGDVGPQQLIRFADDNLSLVAEEWQNDLTSDDAARRRLAQEVERRAANGEYSVAPLFNDADRQVGQLIVVDGVARRIVQVDASGSSSGDVNDIARQLGIDHYYEMEVFTDDSQNRPLMFCVRQLPPGMTTGDDVREPVRVAGFFFKSWRYRTRDAGGHDDNLAKSDGLGRRLIAPLIIGRGPVRIESEQSGGETAEILMGGAFVLALLAIWGVGWWFARGDRRFRQRTPAAGFSLPPGESLDGLNVPAVDEPMKIAGSSSETSPSR